MRRLISTGIALLVLLGGGSAALARQDTPGGIALGPGITASFAVSVPVDALPKDSSISILARYTLAPGAEVPPSAGSSVALVYVESGELALTGTGAASIFRGGTANPKAEPNDPAVEEILAAGDMLYTPLCSESGLRNDGAEPASILLGGVTGLTEEGCPGATPSATPSAESSANPGVTADFFALGASQPLPALPAQIGIAKVTYAPGAADQPGPNSGTVLAHVDSGTFALTMDSGEATIIRKPATPEDFFAAQQDPLVEGVEATLNPGDMVWEASGTSIGGRNAGTEPATVVIFVLAAASAESGTPTT